MTREEAIDILRSYLMFDKSNMQIDIALNMAIEALQREEAEENGWCHRIRPKNVEVVVRCKDCKWYKKIVEKSKSGLCHYDIVARCLHDEDYCSHGERREL